MTEKQLAILTLVVAVFACIGAYLVIPQVQQWITQSLTPTHPAKSIATSTSIPSLRYEVNVDGLVQTSVAATITAQQSATTAAPAAVPTLTSTSAPTQLTSQTLTFTSTPPPPTATPNIPPTPIQTTEPGIILEDGDTAIGDGLMLKASFFCVLDCDFEYDYTPAQIAVDFILRNISGEEYIIPDIPSDGLLIKLGVNT